MKGDNVLLSIIIPVYNVEQYISKCLDSIVAKEPPNKIEVIIVDDGSKDSSGAIADSYAEKYPYIRVIHKANAGVAAARNTGIDNAKGQWLYFVDSDDWLAKGAVDIIYRRALESDSADILMFDAYKNTDKAETGWEHFSAAKVFERQDEIRSLERGMLYFPLCDLNTTIPLAAPWDKVYSRRFVVENKLKFNPKLKVLDDMIFNMEAFGKAKRIEYFKDKIFHYRYVDASITNSYSPNRVRLDMDVWDYIEKYMDENRGIGDEKFIQAYYCRIIKSFSICCRLCFFNPQNQKSLLDKIKAVRQVMNMEPYKRAFKNVKLKNAEWKLKVMVIIGRAKFSFGVWLLHIAQNGLK